MEVDLLRVDLVGVDFMRVDLVGLAPVAIVSKMGTPVSERVFCAPNNRKGGANAP